MRWLRSVSHWLVHHIIEHWFAIAMAIGAGVMTTFAYLSPMLEHYGLVAWGGVGLVSALVIAVILWILSISSDRFADSRLKQALSTPTATVNPLRNNFTEEKVKVSDFFSPFHQQHSGKHFRKCHIHGPGVIVLLNDCALFSPRMIACDLVKVPDEIELYTAVGFERSTFEDCVFANVTLFLPPHAADAMVREAAKKNIDPNIIGNDKKPDEERQ